LSQDLETSQILTPSQIEDIRLASSKMQGANRRAFQAEMALKYCRGSARLSETIFGWKRQTVDLGLAEKRGGITCVGAQSALSGRKPWEECQPEAADALRQLAESYGQQDPTFQSSIAYTRLTAAAALKQLAEQGFKPEQLPAASTMSEILNRMGYRLRKVVKAKPQKKIPETDAIFKNIEEKDQIAKSVVKVKRLSLDSKATVKIGDYSRGGKTRGDNQACDHDMGGSEQYIPCGILDEGTGQLYINFGSSFKTSDFIVDTLQQWWETLTLQERQESQLIQIKVDNGPESSGVRTQFLRRMVEWADAISKPIQLLYYPPYHSKYNPIERCWGILELHWNGAMLTERETMLAWAKTMTWKGASPLVSLSQKVYQKGISLSKKVMSVIEKRLERNPLLPKWDILIQPA
jgi:hypothetical protein